MCFIRLVGSDLPHGPLPLGGSDHAIPEPGRESFYEHAQRVSNIHQASETPAFQAVGSDSGGYAAGTSPGGWLWGTSDDTGLSRCHPSPNTLPGSHHYDAADAYHAANTLANGKTQPNTDGYSEASSDPYSNQDANSHPYFSLHPVAWGTASVLRRN